MNSSRRHDWRALRQRTHATLSPQQALPKKQNKRALGKGIAGDKSAHCNNEDHYEKLRPPNTAKTQQGPVPSVLVRSRHVPSDRGTGGAIRSDYRSGLEGEAANRRS